MPLAEFAVLETSTQLALLEGDVDECRRLVHRAQQYLPKLQGLRESSYGLSILQTHARLEASCGQWAEAKRVAEEGLTLAVQAEDPLFRAQFCAALACSLTALGRTDEAVGALQRGFDAFLFPPPAIRAGLERALAFVLHRQGLTDEAHRLLHGARLTARSISNAILLKEIDATEALIRTESPARIRKEAKPPLVALLDAADRPDVLGRLCFDRLVDSAADASFGLCRRDAATHVVDTHNWTETQALQAIAEQSDDHTLTIALGENGSGRHLLVVAQPLSLPAYLAVGDVRKTIAAALALQQVTREAKKNQSIWSDRDFEVASGAIYLAPPMLEILRHARRLAPINVPVLLTGETGVGKEVVARLIHDASNRAAKPFIPFNCGAVPREMLESQLFGYKRGAFTGAHESFAGIIRAATGGTVFLDEIGDVPAEIQPKLLRFLETGEVHPLGEPEPMKADVRIMAATNRPLEAAVAQGTFREDLYYRLNVVPLPIPPLRERREEIPALANQFLRRYADEFNRGALTMTPETVEYLATYSWPGNVRQLLNEMRRVAALAEPGSAITPRMLTPEISRDRTVEPAAAVAEAAAEVDIRLDQPLPAAVAMLEKALIERALEKTKGRMEDAAKMLGISRKGLFLKRRRLAPRASGRSH
jgi:DNA-binding NtrC family response regulator